MNGPEHYREAERLVGLVENGEWVDTGMPGDDVEVVLGLLGAAQVHATLALAAATAENDAETGKSEAECRAWGEVL